MWYICRHILTHCWLYQGFSRLWSHQVRPQAQARPTTSQHPGINQPKANSDGDDHHHGGGEGAGNGKSDGNGVPAHNTSDEIFNNFVFLTNEATSGWMKRPVRVGLAPRPWSERRISVRNGIFKFRSVSIKSFPKVGQSCQRWWLVVVAQVVEWLSFDLEGQQF